MVKYSWTDFSDIRAEVLIVTVSIATTQSHVADKLQGKEV